MTIPHEIGHAIGLSHPDHYNGGSSACANDAEYAQDTPQWTVMPCFSASQTGADWNGGGDGFTRTVALFDAGGAGTQCEWSSITMAPQAQPMWWYDAQRDLRSDETIAPTSMIS